MEEKTKQGIGGNKLREIRRHENLIFSFQVKKEGVREGSEKERTLLATVSLRIF